jgi:predicted transcriptional regulator
MATLSITVDDAVVSKLRPLAASKGFASSNAGVKAMILDYVRREYIAYQKRVAETPNAATVAAAVVTAEAEAEAFA